MNNTSIALNTVRIIFGLTAICGNLLIVICVFKYKVLRTPTNLVIANLAAADLWNGSMMVALPLINFIICAGYSEKLPWDTHKGIKPRFVLLGFVMNNLAIFFIALERFICIKLALRYNSIITFSRILFTAVLTWICGAIFIFSLILFNLALRRMIIYCFYVIINVGTLTFCIYVVIVAYKKSRDVAPQPQVMDGNTSEVLDNHKVQWKITKFLALVLGIYCVSYLPWIAFDNLRVYFLN